MLRIDGPGKPMKLTKKGATTGIGKGQPHEQDDYEGARHFRPPGVPSQGGYRNIDIMIPVGRPRVDPKYNRQASTGQNH
jgi:hypothetical protein